MHDLLYRYALQPDEHARVKALHAAGWLSGKRDGALDRLTTLAATLFDVPMCLVTLIGASSQHLVGRHGVDVDQSPNGPTFCTYTMRSDAAFIVPDATKDPRFSANPLVTGDPQIRFYAGAPVSNIAGERLGTFCIIDDRPRATLDEAQQATLQRFAALAGDIIHRRDMAERAHDAETFAEMRNQALISTDDEGTITSWNDAAARLLGYSAQEMIGETLEMIMPERFRAAHSAGFDRVRQSGKSRLMGQPFELTALRRDGTELPIELVVCHWQSGGRMRFGASMTDISERKARESDLLHRALHDDLTGLLNQRSFHAAVADALAAAAATGTGLGLMTLDLDGFKQTNDTLGHAVGDTLLQMIAVRLQTMCAPGTFAGRLGGDEFAVAITGCSDLLRLHSEAKRLLDLIKLPYVLEGVVVHIDASIGLALADPAAASVDEVFVEADLAMFAAKRGGGSRIRPFDATMRSELAARRTMQQELCDAHKAGQWELHYQPQIELATGRLKGVEALLRWRHPAWGLLLPSAFMPVLETHGLAHLVGDWVLDEACRQLAAWRAEGLVVPRVGVNLFAAQVHTGRLPATVDAVIAKHGLAPADLELEVLESITLQQENEIHLCFQTLVTRGVGVALDDFGTGFASLSTVKRFPMTRLKIDRSFIADLATDERSQGIVRGMLETCRVLGLDIIAEGIERPEQAALLRAFGCTEGQGYLFAKPLAAAALAASLRERPWPGTTVIAA